MTDHDADIATAARVESLDVRLVEAIVMVESSGYTFAFNPEPRYRYFWDCASGKPFREIIPLERLSKFPPADFTAFHGDHDAEWWLQQSSIGLMQVMGAVAREHLCRTPSLLELVTPHIGLYFGCRHLADLLHWAGQDTERAVRAYNAGRGNWESAAGAGYWLKVQRQLGGM